MNKKKCPCCSKYLSITEFGQDKRTKDKLNCYCKKCVRAKAADYRKTDRYKEAHKKYYESGRANELQKRYRSTPKGRVCMEKQRERKKRFNQTDSGKRKTKEESLQRRYGLSIEAHYQMWVNQKGQCDLCGKPLNYKKVCTDHNHISNLLRGLTCQTCNSLLGFAYVDEYGVELLHRAIDYIRRHEKGKN